MVRLLHLSAGSKAAEKDDPAKASRLTAMINRQKSTLTIGTATANDMGVYYCAVWSSDTQCWFLKEALTKSATVA